MSSPQPDSLPESSSRVPTFQPPQKVTAPGITVRPGRPSRPQSPTPSTPPTNPGTSDSADAYAVADPLDESQAGSTGTRSASDKAPAAEFDKAALREVARGVLMGLTLALHGYLARTDAEQAEQVWIADDEDLAGIADPLTNVAARHGGPGMANPDAADLLTAAFGVVAYGIKNVMKSAALRKANRKLKANLPDLAETPEAAA